MNKVNTSVICENDVHTGTKKIIPPDSHSQDTWKSRMCSLDDCEQKKIAQKYYGGTMPWKDYQNKQC
ncbi:MAG: hypothetical protein Q4F95_12215 [Oscillospiraceae bacterium]|nr:hypothetical protein [Oscillospiraceae bacterium]